MLKRLSLSVVLALWACSSYSESITPYAGQTGNAAKNGHSWSMDGILPIGVPGLDINAVIYNYKIHKGVDDTVGVEIRNENANGNGYIFRERDEWLPGSLDGTTINKAVPVVPSNRSLWGRGEIAVDGNGSVSEANVIYNYKVDPCYDPQFDPNCPGYQVPVPDIYEVDIATLYDAMDDPNIDLDRTTEVDDKQSEDEEQLSEEEKEEKEKAEKEKKKERLEKALAAADNSAMFATALAQAQVLASMNAAVQMNSYYGAKIPGGTYNETIVLVDKQLPENKRGLRNGLAQQLLHEKMVEMQY